MATIFEDDFNSYNDGSLEGQGGWQAWDVYQTDVVQGDVVKEGAKAVKLVTNSDTDHLNCKQGTALTDGRLTVYFYITNHAGWASNVYINIARIGDARWGVKFQVAAMQNGYLNIYPTIGDWVTFTDDEWHYLEIEWRSSPSDQFRVRLDGGTWTDWTAGVSAWANGLDWWGFSCDHNMNNNPSYIDYIAEEPISEVHPRSHGYIF